MLWISCYPQPCDAMDRNVKKKKKRTLRKKSTNRSKGEEGKTGRVRKKKKDVGEKKYRSNAEAGMENMISVKKKKQNTTISLRRSYAGRRTIDGQGEESDLKSLNKDWHSMGS